MTSFPTVIVTVEPCWSFPWVGDCARTRPSWVGSVTSCSITDTVSPACWSRCLAVSTSFPVTVGTSTISGPFETESVTVEPFATVAPAPGLCETTVFGWRGVRHVHAGRP